MSLKLKNKDPLVSVVIPVFNGEKYIAEALNNVFQQTFRNIEIIVVDDCSRDDTIKILQKYVRLYKNIKIIELRHNSGGPAFPRNIGVRAAKGSYIAFLDCDDLWHREKLRLQIDLLEKENYPAICAGCRNFEGVTVDCGEKLNNAVVRKITYQSTLNKSRIPLSTLVVRSDIAKKIEFEVSKKFIGREDYLYTLDLLKIYRELPKLEQALMYYRVHPGQISSNKLVMLFRQYRVLQRQYENCNSIYKNSMVVKHLIFHVVLGVVLRVFLKKI